ncbi:PREDICTED: vitamin K epoxide reductase complex subunit 1-like protein 1 [Dufourea novaeangliae]|uniref:vitamin-K-epoxide reductase (warfarin-sensitive) n=1 Tax=Dufourea novaeangliae TaxID=178035 RepID=A0A154P0T4_DUFNO|nr:PREDICTED: vitamin K epoxide reductase complex subunit 1-like protein 1 [Dufourea novaeangliae]KZC05471.1 Vitamin K epoxide reductase complex subunit 1-like protein 1 [Dufourea novaeangliae]
MSKQSVWILNAGITSICLLGLVACFYTHVVEELKAENDSYVALCDISDHISCSKVFTTEYAKGLGIIPKTSILYMPNYMYGVIFYTLVAILSMFNKYPISAIAVTLAVCSNLATLYLAYLLYIINSICVVCVSTYIINFIILILTVKKHRNLFRDGTNKTKKRKKKSE